MCSTVPAVLVICNLLQGIESCVTYKWICIVWGRRSLEIHAKSSIQYFEGDHRQVLVFSDNLNLMETPRMKY